MTGNAVLAARGRLLAQVDEAARVVAPLWPLSTFIAVNPLWDLRELPFDEAIAQASQVLGISGYPSMAFFAQAYRRRRVTDADLRAALEDRSLRPTADLRRDRAGVAATSRTLSATERHDVAFGTRLAATADREVAKWSAAYLAGVLPPHPAGGFYAAWRAVVARDPAARRIAGRAGRVRLAGLPAQVEDAVLQGLERLGIPEEDRVPELARQLGRMPGWAGHAKWRSRWAAPDHPGPELHLLDYLAVRLGYEAELLSTAVAGRADLRHRGEDRGLIRGWVRSRSGWPRRDAEAVDPPVAPVAVPGLPADLQEELSRLPAREAAKTWLSAYESHYRDRLLAILDQETTPAAALPGRGQRGPVAQAVFCLDVRSEGLRRHLEEVGPYETFGAAGFFALPIRYRPWGSAEAVDLCPVLVRPGARIAEQPGEQTSAAARRSLTGRQAQAAAQTMFDTARKAAASSFILAEVGGLLAGPIAFARTLTPARYVTLRTQVGRMLAPSVRTLLPVEPADSGTDDELAMFAEAALTTMGLTRNFAPVVVFCGHGSTTANNPYASSLDCGACGGNRGGASARATVAILNRAATRQLLAARGIQIPEHTVFVAAEHDTATDDVMVLDPHLVPPTHQGTSAALQADLRRAGARLAAERAKRLPQVMYRDATAEVTARSADWAQVQPEWGLARNAALIVAPRNITAGRDLEGRCFLHSYDAADDPDGIALETILTAPMLVAHWINAQYYFSTVDPDVLSAGDKTVHNIVGGIGVVQGPGGDLRVGLPRQSLFDAGQAYHEPMRLLTLVQAPQGLLETVVSRNSVLRELFDGQWVQLLARDDSGDTWKIRQPGGVWMSWVPAGPRSKRAATRG